MTKQRIGVLVVSLLLTAAGVAQTPPAKQTAAEKKRRGAQPAGDARLGTMDGHSCNSAGRNAVSRDGRNGKDSGPAGRPDDGWPFVHSSAFLHRRTKIAPHWHPTTENVTVIKGTFLLGMGAKWNDAAMKELPVGGFASAPAQMRHYAQCKGDGVVQVNGIGPFVVNFVGPDDSGPAKNVN